MVKPFRSYVGPRPTLWFSCSGRFSWSLTLSNPFFLPPTYSPALIYFGRETGWWVTCNYPTVLKEKNINRKSTTCVICVIPIWKVSRSRCPGRSQNPVQDVKYSSVSQFIQSSLTALPTLEGRVDSIRQTVNQPPSRSNRQVRERYVITFSYDLRLYRRTNYKDVVQ
jgi:hypothetical protein